MLRRSLLVVALALLAGCQPPAPAPQPNPGGNGPPPAGSAKRRIAVIPKGTTHEFWKSVHFGAEEAAKKYGVEILWLGPLLENDRQGQITVVENFTTQKVDGIVLAPLDSSALVEPVRQAKKAGIPVVIFDSALDDEQAIVSYVATDNRKGGALAADEMAKRLGGKGNVILFRYNPGSESTQQREDGFLEAIARHAGIKVISDNQYLGTTPESSLDKAQQVFTAQQGQFHGVFAVCEPNATGVLGALDELKLAEKTAFIGFDPSPRMVESLAAGKMKGIVLQDPVKMGYLAVEALVRHLDGQPVEKRISTGEYLATPENLKEPEMAKLLAPKQFGE